MRSLAETKKRWEETFKHGPRISDLQRAIKFNGSESPCVAGLRSLCWKGFLLFPNASAEEWPQLLRQLRSSYDTLCEQHLNFIRHPEQLAALPFDPLADDPDSPWITVRKDEAIRAEIQQDVSRLPDDPFYHQATIQTMILDILFLYCKLNPSASGYRQGMHELLAPIVYAVAQDSVDNKELSDASLDPIVLELLDSSRIEHDSFALFSKVMDRAGAFYEVDSDGSRNTIVDKSKYIHEVALLKADEELANHLRSIEILPQIFLIRWIRLLFGREFPFEQTMVLWDAIFAFDPNLEMIDLICVAMLLRIRWTLLEADYSVALQLLLKYPAPAPPHGPHTFVDDALYLRNHFDAAGGVALITKYSGRLPAAASTTTTTAASTPARSSTPSFQGFGSLRQRTLGARSPLSSTTKLLQQPGGVEAILRGAAKNVIEKSEKLGINDAVRDAVGEIRRNMQGLQDARSSPRVNRTLFSDHALAVSVMEQRNRQLATMLEESIANLKQLVATDFEGDKQKRLETVEVATAKIQYVKACLEDSTLDLPEDEPPTLATLSISTQVEIRSPTVALDTTPVVMTSSAVEEARSRLSSPASSDGNKQLASVPEEAHVAPAAEEMVDKMDTDPPERKQTPPPAPPPASETSPPISKTPTVSPTPRERPKGPIPTRSTLAQSSFAWMLEPDTTISARSPPSRPMSSSGGKKRHNPSREKNAFLFGEVVPSDGAAGERTVSPDEIFGLQPIRKT
ncbi:rab-GTPase-TBC domain-containing protein [Triangularia verruculosa]|uniref:Rab-GTPase-TBC domain-containing protein n=1 Tax=Triangularia verruculosa TaxID=2587418 RepID=A0AAN7ATQ6_9PEZI|nr:rab-GTPase-TBC domain-containing protein [Triangularia verruculosa]